MIQVKIFGFGSVSYSIPEDINKWLKENPNIEIVDTLQSLTTVPVGDTGRYETQLIISIFYKEKE